jgi:hypothetical protein
VADDRRNPVSPCSSEHKADAGQQTAGLEEPTFKKRTLQVEEIMAATAAERILVSAPANSASRCALRGCLRVVEFEERAVLIDEPLDGHEGLADGVGGALVDPNDPLAHRRVSPPPLQI